MSVTDSLVPLLAGREVGPLVQKRDEGVVLSFARKVH